MLDFKNKKITVMGLGLHGGGVAVTEFLAKKGAFLTVTDLKSKAQLQDSIKQLKPFKINYVLGQHRLKDFEQADLIIKNPGVPQTSKFLAAARKKGIPIEIDLSLFLKFCPSRQIIGITGTKGKSTTTTLLYQMFKHFNKNTILGGNIRISPLNFLPKIRKDTPVILELSSWQLEDLAEHNLNPAGAILTNVLRDHLNTYKNMAAYVRAKELIFKFQKPQDILILNKDNEYTAAMAKKTKAKVYWYSLGQLIKSEKGCFIKKGWAVFKNGKIKKVLPLSEIQIRGSHNLSNVLAAVTLALAFGLPVRLIRSVVKRFKGLASRLELVREFQGVKYYNDTTATTPDAVVAALDSFEQKVVLLAGGTDKKLDFKALAKVIKEKVKALILFEGTATAKLVKELRKINFNKNLVFVDSMPEAFKQAKYILEKGDIFLLSPGAASFGLFINEFDRGEQFNKAVRQLGKK